MCLRVNFGKAYYYGFPKDMAMLSNGKIYIGQDAALDPANRLPAVLDDLCICSRALGEEEIRRLECYYQM